MNCVLKLDHNAPCFDISEKVYAISLLVDLLQVTKEGEGGDIYNPGQNIGDTFGYVVIFSLL